MQAGNRHRKMQQHLPQTQDFEPSPDFARLEPGEVRIENVNEYLSDMAKTFPDKAWFIGYIKPEIDTIVDFGGGTGDFCKYIAEQAAYSGRSFKFVVIDNNESFAASAREKGYLVFANLSDMLTSQEVPLDNALLVMSSVIHEIYSYAKHPWEIGIFWADVRECDFKQIAIRDMNPCCEDSADVPTDDIVWVYENVLKAPTLTVNGTKVSDILHDFENVWGAICDCANANVNIRNLMHFLFKYRYVRNWRHELYENYFPLTQNALESILTGLGYRLVRKDSTKLRFYDKAWARDFHLDCLDGREHRLKFRNWLYTLNTHVKWLAEK